MRWIVLPCLFMTLAISSCALPGGICGVPVQGGATNQNALELLSCRAIGGDKQAQISLARAYETGIGAPRDMKKAVEWYTRAATPSTGRKPGVMEPLDTRTQGSVQEILTGTETPGDTWAQFRLGEIYLAGDGVKQSDRRARKWLKRAADRGFGPAAELLAGMEAE